jgi:hypothetical protein
MRRPPLAGLMQTPARAAERLFLGLGIALLLATAFALIDGRLPPADCPEPDASLIDEPCTSSSPIGWLVPVGAALGLGLGLVFRTARQSGTSPPFGKYFPNESESQISERVSKEHSDAHDIDRLSGAWANMETKMLESTHGEEE